MKKRILVMLGAVVMVCCTLGAQANKSFLSDRPLYVQLSTGLVGEDWADFDSGQSWKFDYAGKTGIGFGGVIGLGLYKHLSGELGMQFLPKAEYTQAGTKYNISQFLSYLASRITVTVSPNMALFTRVGLGYRSFDNSQPGYGSGNVIAPVFGVGLNYFFSKVFWGGFSYTHQPGKFTGDTADRAPNYNEYSLTLMYRFRS